MHQRIMFAVGLSLLVVLLAVRLAAPSGGKARPSGGRGRPPEAMAAAVTGERPGGGTGTESRPPPAAPERQLASLPLPQMIRDRLAGLIELPPSALPVLKREMLAAAAAAGAAAASEPAPDGNLRLRTGTGLGVRGGHGSRSATPGQGVEEGVEPDEDVGGEGGDFPLRLWRRFSENVLGELELALLLQGDGEMLSGGAVVLRQQLPPGWEIVAVRPEPQVRQPQRLKWLLVPAEPTRELLVHVVLRPPTPAPAPAAAAVADRASWPSAFRCRPAAGDVVAGVGCDLP